ncbi:MAG TPA: MoaD/ThiS family protein [Kofleriaceae bacterium]|nr:MoaD/ThiS family protein [Kofleriaceae bacterium]
MPNVQIPSSLRRLTGGNAEIVTTATTIRDAIADLDRRYPGIAARVLDGNGAVKPFMRVFIGSEDMESLKGLDTPIGEHDEISIVPALAGGVGHVPG